MSEPIIPGGYILLSRKIVESEIFSKPPLYLKVWVYLLSLAQHKDFKQLKRGQLFIDIPTIQKACSWKVGYRTETPTYKEIRGVIDWLRKPNEGITKGSTKGNTEGTMIVTTKGTQGMLVTIDKYSFYQQPQNYEGQTEGQDEEQDERITTDERRAGQGHNINKNDKNDKNEKDIIVLTQDEEEFISVLKTVENYPVDLTKDRELFITLAERYPTLDLITAIKDWAVYKKDAPLAKKSNPRSQINTSFKKYVEWNKCLKEEKSKQRYSNLKVVGLDAPIERI